MHIPPAGASRGSGAPLDHSRGCGSNEASGSTARSPIKPPAQQDLTRTSPEPGGGVNRAASAFAAGEAAGPTLTEVDGGGTRLATCLVCDGDGVVQPRSHRPWSACRRCHGRGRIRIPVDWLGAAGARQRSGAPCDPSETGSSLGPVTALNVRNAGSGPPALQSTDAMSRADVRGAT